MFEVWWLLGGFSVGFFVGAYLQLNMMMKHRRGSPVQLSAEN